MNAKAKGGHWESNPRGGDSGARALAARRGALIILTLLVLYLSWSELLFFFGFWAGGARFRDCWGEKVERRRRLAWWWWWWRRRH